MKLLIQRVRRASVTVDGVEVGAIGYGALLLLGVARDDTEEKARWLAGKVSRLRIYDDPEGRLNAPIQSVDGAFLVVSQFTLLGQCPKGNRPAYIDAAPSDQARALYDCFVNALRALGHTVAEGQFQAHMLVSLENDGPVTLMLER